MKNFTKLLLLCTILVVSFSQHSYGCDPEEIMDDKKKINLTNTLAKRENPLLATNGTNPLSSFCGWLYSFIYTRGEDKEKSSSPNSNRTLNLIETDQKTSSRRTTSFWPYDPNCFFFNPYNIIASFVYIAATPCRIYYSYYPPKLLQNTEIDKERIEKERIEKERLEGEEERNRVEAARLEQERLEKQRVEDERLAEEERLEKERLEEEARIAREKEVAADALLVQPVYTQPQFANSNPQFLPSSTINSTSTSRTNSANNSPRAARLSSTPEKNRHREANGKKMLEKRKGRLNALEDLEDDAEIFEGNSRKNKEDSKSIEDETSISTDESNDS
jgi:hypothetical protein